MVDFKGLRDAKEFENGVFLTPGEYEAEITKTIVKNTQRRGPAFIVEFKLISSSNATHAEGGKATWFQKLTDTAVAYPALKAFLYAVSNAKTPEQKAALDEKIEAIFTMIRDGKSDLLNGKRVHITVYPKKTQAGQMIDLYRFSPSNG